MSGASECPETLSEEDHEVDAGHQSDDEVIRALRQGVAVGLRRHLPGGVGLLVKGVPLCGLGAFLHLVLGVDLSTSAAVAVLAHLGIGRVPH
jgi:hypothetical protein